MKQRTKARRATQRPDHDRLLRRVEWHPGDRPTGQRLDALIVPAARRAHNLRGLIELAALHGTTIVVLASHACDIDEAAALVASQPGGKAVLVEVPPEPDHDWLPPKASADRFRPLNGDRLSNLSAKRNIGLLAARLLGWRKIMFLDDDLIGLTMDHLARVAHHLDRNQFAGLKTTYFPDNSVVCHANRLVGRRQGIFVSGAALGVNTTFPLEVFPDVYNEDWFALADEAAGAGVVDLGIVGQLEFNPFNEPQRAMEEEFGDLIAEGLYALFNDGRWLGSADAEYWTDFIEERRKLIEVIGEMLDDETNQGKQARKSLEKALAHLGTIMPSDCTDFIDTWQADRSRFKTVADTLRGGHDYADTFAKLGLKNWRKAEFGDTWMSVLGATTSLAVW